MFTARYGRTPYIKQITFSLQTVKYFSLIAFICKTDILNSYSEQTRGNNTGLCSDTSGSSVVDNFRDKFCNCISYMI
jgi:hypothetical protein